MDLQIEDTEHLSPEAIEASLKWLDYYRQSLVSTAASARNRGVSWRPKPFKIGCSLLAVSGNPDLAEPQLYTSANYKPQGGEWDWPERRCGEMSTVYQALKDQCKFIPAIVTVTNERSTGESGTENHDIVHPCVKCREMFKDLMQTGVISPKTRIYNVRDDGSGKVLKDKEMTIGELLQKYEDIDLHQ